MSAIERYQDRLDAERANATRLRHLLERVEALWSPTCDAERALLEEIRAELARRP